MENIVSTKDRLSEIERELKGLKNSQAKLKAKWVIEKNHIQQIRLLKSEIEKLKTSAEQYERDGNLEKVAEIRYGKVHDLEKELEKTNDKLASIQKEKKLLNEEVGVEDIAEIVANWTGIPVQSMLESERTKLINMEERIQKRLIGQDSATISVANAIRRSRSGLQDSTKPIASFIFLGSTGVGKTELAKALAEFLFDDETAITRVDMSEYMEKISTTRLLGAPPGYVGYEAGGQLTEPIRKRPYSIVLLDEIEKAHPDVFNVLLQLLDDGRLTDGKGRTVNFNNTIIIMTSNIGTEYIQKEIEKAELNSEEIINKVKPKIMDLLKNKMRPEFLNRIDELIVFKPLDSTDIAKIAELQIEGLKKQLSKLGVNINITKSALDWIAKLGYDSIYGARPLKRAIQKHITDSLSMSLLKREFVSGDSVTINAKDNGIFEFTKDA